MSKTNKIFITILIFIASIIFFVIIYEKYAQNIQNNSSDSGASNIPSDSGASNMPLVNPDGCGGQFDIINFKINKNLTNIYYIPDSSEYIIFEINNCNGGVVDVKNYSNKQLVIGDEIFLPYSELGSPFNTFYLNKINGQIKAVKTTSNFSEYSPEDKEELSIEASIADNKFIISYTIDKN